VADVKQVLEDAQTPDVSPTQPPPWGHSNLNLPRFWGKPNPLRWGIPMSISLDLGETRQKLTNCTNGSKNALGIPPERAFRGSPRRIFKWVSVYVASSVWPAWALWSGKLDGFLPTARWEYDPFITVNLSHAINLSAESVANSVT